MKGYRKLIMFMMAAAIVAFIPLTPTNGGVLETLIIVGVGGNAIEHLSNSGVIDRVKGVFNEKMAVRRARRDSGSDCSPDGASKERPEKD
jgi:hypothetical protein